MILALAVIFHQETRSGRKQSRFAYNSRAMGGVGLWRGQPPICCLGRTDVFDNHFHVIQILPGAPIKTLLSLNLCLIYVAF